MKSFQLNYVVFVNLCMVLAHCELCISAPFKQAIASFLTINLTGITIEPSNTELEDQIRKQFTEKGVIEISHSVGAVTFRISVTCTSDSPPEWKFDNMRYMHITGTSPRIFPSRRSGNGTLQFRSEIVIEAALMDPIWSRRGLWLTGKYTCGCSTGDTREKYFYTYFESDPTKVFVQSSKFFGLRPEPEEKWVGLGCTTQTPNASITLWKNIVYVDAHGLHHKKWERLIEGEKVRRDASQGFAVAVDAENSEQGEYRCNSTNSNDTVSSILEAANQTYIDQNSPVLTFNRTTNEYVCCMSEHSPLGSFINCNNVDECNFQATRLFGDPFLPAIFCSKTSGESDTWCCRFSAPRVGGLLRCVNPYEGPVLRKATLPRNVPLRDFEDFYVPTERPEGTFSSIIVEDERPLSKKPIIVQDLENKQLALQCTASSFKFSNYLYWILLLKNGSTLSVDDSTSEYIIENSTCDYKSGTITSKIQIPKDIDVKKASCFGPLIGSAEFRSGSMEFDEPIGPLGRMGLPIIISGSLTALVLGILIVSIGFRYMRPARVLTSADIREFLEGTTEDIIPLVDDDNDEHMNCENACSDLLRLPYNQDFEYSRNKFIYDKKDSKLGEGAFGIVYRGRLRVSGDEEFDVAIKMISGNVTREKLISILAEIKIMSYVGSHKNVINLIGAHTRLLNRNTVLMAVELCGEGSLEGFICKNKTEFNRDPITGYDIRVPNFSTRTLLKWAHEIADGMVFLSSKNVIHVDLATRNVFLTDGLIPKIGDFGLSRRLYTKEIYLKKSKDYMPIYWMALESLEMLTFSTQSDVWSYGVTMWEMFALNCEPYTTTQNTQKPNWDQLEMFLRSGKRLLQPVEASSEIFGVMLQCWHADPQERPSFEALRNTFLDHLNKFDQFDLH